MSLQTRPPYSRRRLCWLHLPAMLVGTIIFLASYLITPTFNGLSLFGLAVLTAATVLAAREADRGDLS